MSADTVHKPRVKTHIDFQAMTRVFEQAAREDRQFLFEYEVYILLRHLGSETPPRSILLVGGTRPSDEELLALPGERVVLKIVSPYIVHKSDVGGVRIITKQPDKIRSTWRRMMYEVAESYADRIEMSVRKWHRCSIALGKYDLRKIMLSGFFLSQVEHRLAVIIPGDFNRLTHFG